MSFEQFTGFSQPWACSLAGLWHRRPPDDVWTPGTGDEPNCVTLCGQRIPTAFTASASTGPPGPICPACLTKFLFPDTAPV